MNDSRPYLLLVHCDTTWLTALPPDRRVAFEAACLAELNWLRQNGRLRVEAAVEDSRGVATVQIVDEQIAVSGESLSETTATFSGFIVVEARDLNDALRVAAQLPQVRGGPIEVWPLALCRVSAD